MEFVQSSYIVSEEEGLGRVEVVINGRPTQDTEVLIVPSTLPT